MRLGSKGNNHVKCVEPLGEIAGVGEFTGQLRVDVKSLLENHGGVAKKGSHVRQV